MPKGLKRLTEKDVLELQRLARRAGVTIPEVAPQTIMVKLSRKEVNHISTMLSTHETIVVCRNRRVKGEVRQRGVRIYKVESYQKMQKHMASMHQNGKLGKRS